MAEQGRRRGAPQRLALVPFGTRATPGSQYRATLYRAAPWTRIESDSQLLRLQAAWAGFEDGCVSVIGTLGEHRGLALFESVEDFRAFARLLDEGDFSEGERGRGPGVPMLSVHFDPARSLSGVMRAQVKQHRWPAPGAKAHPWVLRMDDDGVRRPLTETDYAPCARRARPKATSTRPRSSSITCCGSRSRH